MMLSEVEDREQIEQICTNIVEEFLHLFFTERDIASVIQKASEHLTGFGPSLADIAFTYDQSLRYLKRDFNQVSSSILYEVKQSRIIQLSDDIFLYISVFDLELTSRAQDKIPLEGLRMSLILRLGEDSHAIEHLHLSYPADAKSVSFEQFSDGKPLTDLIEDMVQYKVQDINSAYRELEVMLSTDKLTGLRSRIKIDEVLDEELKRASRYDSTFSIVMMDLDSFKMLNDCYGHLFGDYILKEFGSLLNSSLRETDFAGRWGGDEFLLMLPQTPMPNAEVVMQKLRKKYSRISLKEMIERYQADHPGLFNVGNCEDFQEALNLFPYRRLSFSYGIAEYRISDTIHRMINRADIGLYEMKRRKDDD